MDHAELISKMTDEEKASLCSGADFWHTKGVARLGIPQMMLTDGPHGLRKQIGKNDHLGLNAAYPATCFPTASAAANSWDEAMIEQMGRRLGAETRAQRVGVILGPGVNIKRSPLCGRNFEYYSEDPLLAGKCAAALIRGVQSNGIAACVKHFAANSQETLRMTSDSVMDERTLREIYLPAFEIAVKEGRVKCLMTSYNMLNGQYTNENEHLLQDILTREWGYDGLIVTDWGGDNDRVRGLIAGNSLEMPGTGGETDRQILEAVQSGAVERELLDERVARLLRLVSDAEEAFGNAPGCDMAEHHEFAARFAEECAVLLKNEDGILPLRPGARIAVIGDFAKTPRYQGAGSSHIEPTKLECGLDALRTEGVNVIGFAPGFRRSGGESFAALLGREIPPHLWNRDEPLEFNSALVQGAFRPGIGRLLYRALRLVYGFFRLTGNTEGANNTEFALNLPYRGLARFTGAVTEVQVKALLRAANREKGGLHGLVCAFMRKK